MFKRDEKLLEWVQNRRRYRDQFRPRVPWPDGPAADQLIVDEPYELREGNGMNAEEQVEWPMMAKSHGLVGALPAANEAMQGLAAALDRWIIGPRLDDGPCVVKFIRRGPQRTLWGAKDRDPIYATSYREVHQRLRNWHRSLGPKWETHILVTTGPSTYWEGRAIHGQRIKWKHLGRKHVGLGSDTYTLTVEEPYVKGTQ